MTPKIQRWRIYDNKNLLLEIFQNRKNATLNFVGETLYIFNLIV
jgi:hypothetical protein